MRKLMAVVMTGAVLGLGGISWADPETPEATIPSVVETTATVAVSGFKRYVVNPVQFVHRFAWGVLSVAYRIGKAPVDAGFKLVGQTIGTVPNEPLWE